MMGFQVGVVGASGAVGRRMVSILESRRFPVGRLRLFASERSAGQRLEFAGKRAAVTIVP